MNSRTDKRKKYVYSGVNCPFDMHYITFNLLYMCGCNRKVCVEGDT